MPSWTFFPDYSASNPYQSCLAASLGDCAPGRIEDALADVYPGAVFHQHWEDAIYSGASDPGAAASSYLADLDAFIACGGRLVWTLHNAAPHEDAHPGLSAALRAALVRRAAIVHVHGQAAAEHARALGADETQILVVPHPGFHGACPDDITDAQARRYFGLPPDVTVFAHLGAMRPYKGLDALHAAFAALHERRRNTALILAGRGAAPQLGRFVVPAPGTLLLPRHVEDATVQYVMRAADFVVLPYTRITTSSGLMMALTFRRPVIVPDLPAMTEIVTQGCEGMIYNAGSVTALSLCLDQACSVDRAGRERMRNHARGAADRLTFSDMATMLRSAVQRVGLARAA